MPSKETKNIVIEGVKERKSTLLLEKPEKIIGGKVKVKARKRGLMSETFVPGTVAGSLPPHIRRFIRYVYSLVKGIGHYAEARLYGLAVSVHYKWDGINPYVIIYVDVEEFLKATGALPQSFRAKRSDKVDIDLKKQHIEVEEHT